MSDFRILTLILILPMIGWNHNIYMSYAIELEDDIENERIDKDLPEVLLVPSDDDYGIDEENTLIRTRNLEVVPPVAMGNPVAKVNFESIPAGPVGGPGAKLGVDPVATVPISGPGAKFEPHAEVIIDQIHDPAEIPRPVVQPMVPVKAEEQEESLEEYYEDSDYEEYSYEDMGYNDMVDQPMMAQRIW